MSMLYPIFAMVLLTFIIGFIMGGLRLRCAFKRQVDLRYYLFLSGYTPPDYVRKFERNFANLLEVPVLFYLLGVICLILQINSPLMILLAWLFVIIRIIHTLIHVTYNAPYHRFYAFLASSTILLGMWFYLVTRVVIMT